MIWSDQTEYSSSGIFFNFFFIFNCLMGSLLPIKCLFSNKHSSNVFGIDLKCGVEIQYGYENKICTLILFWQVFMLSSCHDPRVRGNYKLQECSVNELLPTLCWCGSAIRIAIAHSVQHMLMPVAGKGRNIEKRPCLMNPSIIGKR